MKNKLTDLNDILFAQLERLNDEDMEADELAVEISRTNAITSTATQVIANARLILDANKTAREYGLHKAVPLLGIDGN